jgi:hypothetical protein
MGQALEMPEIYSMGNEILDLSTFPEKTILEHMANNTVRYKMASKVPQPLRSNYDYGELWPKVLDDYRSGKIHTIVDYIRKKKKAGNRKKKKATYMPLLDSCGGSQADPAYWIELLHSKPSPTIVDFISYVKGSVRDSGDDV